ncbi:RNA polymerase sigma-70 factor (ECF subfamily) [Herbaspirillum sp. Sphag1AN]|uniref:sigma-70 family RNA polymerase sigma factor n=1 Tax=unclassified Herbaspirillum TaxID=2624150 RepID=UPI00160CC18A|nr:RNA polymerase sigma-70 factor (ECF subfamily) [Herbaspirillum sp. Sphag1AN]MBB3247210.1 RNA polymerase sigma-70 factor (ECF subfamily) [Herbaspirillum sp. Sphag64]
MSRNFTDDDLRELLPRLRRFALSLTRHESSADDLVQSCLERALSGGTERRDDGDLRSWLFQIMYRHFLDGERRTRRFAGLFSLFGAGEEELAPSTEEIVMSRSALRDFNKLPSDQRVLLLLVSVEGLSYQEIADTLGIKIGTVMSRLSRARKALRALNDGTTITPSLRILK